VIDSADPGFGNLLVPCICDGDPGLRSNIAKISAVGVESGAQVSDENPAFVRCVAKPAIRIVKKVRLGSDPAFYDANTAAEAPVGKLGDDAVYHLRVINQGDEPLTDILISDAQLGIVNAPVASVAPGASVLLTHQVTGFENLFASGHCDRLGTKPNTARVQATGSFTGESISDEDPAFIRCEAIETCDIQLDQRCSVKTENQNGGQCTSAISATTLKYIGPDIRNARVAINGKDGGAAVYEGIDLQNQVTVLTRPSQNGYSVDAGIGKKLGAQTTITINGKVEIIHTSCSAIYVAGQPAPLDAKTPNYPGVQKGDPSANWEVVSFRQSDNQIVNAPNLNGPEQDACTVPAKGAQVTYLYQLRNTSTAPVSVQSVLDSELGQMLNPRPITLPAGATATLKSSPILISAQTHSSAIVSAHIEGDPASICSASDTVVVTPEPYPQQSCADGKPVELVFEYTGESCASRPANDQSGKFKCSGTPRANAPVKLVVKDASVDPAGETIHVGDQVTVTAKGDKFKADGRFSVIQDGKTVQSLTIHLSCSKPLNIGDRFGSLTLRGMTVSASGKPHPPGKPPKPGKPGKPHKPTKP
jgi:hypothetical protein